jgi:hypothetical protein
LLTEEQLRDVDAQIVGITDRYGISSVQEMEERYETGEIDEAVSWRDYQRLDHLQYNQKRLSALIERLDRRNNDTSDHN